MDNNDKKLESLCEELMKHLRENYSPHTSINVDGGRYELLCGIKSGVNKQVWPQTTYTCMAERNAPTSIG